MPPLRALTAPVAAFVLAGCVGTPQIDAPRPAIADTPRFDVFAFFTGRLDGSGALATVFSDTVPIRVASTGRVEGDRLRLVQTIHQGDKPPRTREWIIRQTGPGRYAGSLTDAVGEIQGETRGNRLRLVFGMKDGLQAEQWLTLAPDGRRAFNTMTVRKFGIPVARLAEDIRKRD